MHEFKGGLILIETNPREHQGKLAVPEQLAVHMLY